MAYPYGNSRALPFESVISPAAPTVCAAGRYVHWAPEDIKVVQTGRWTLSNSRGHQVRLKCGVSYPSVLEVKRSGFHRCR